MSQLGPALVAAPGGQLITGVNGIHEPYPNHNSVVEFVLHQYRKEQVVYIQLMHHAPIRITAEGRRKEEGGRRKEEGGREEGGGRKEGGGREEGGRREFCPSTCNLAMALSLSNVVR